MQMKSIIYSSKQRTRAGAVGSGSSLCRELAIAFPWTSSVISHQSKKQRRGEGRKEKWKDCIWHSAPLYPPSHPFNPATTAGAILMPLNAYEVKMCLKERIPVGRAAGCMHRVMNTHTHTHTQIYCTDRALDIQTQPTCRSNTNTFGDIYIQNVFSARCMDVKSLYCTRSVQQPARLSVWAGFFPAVWNWNRLSGDLGIKVCLCEILNQLKCGLFCQIPLNTCSCGQALCTLCGMLIWEKEETGER